MNRMLRRARLWIALGPLLVAALLFSGGSLRYGGPDGLWLRARAEIAAYRPHPQFVPTPLPTPTRALRAVTDVPGLDSPTAPQAPMDDSGTFRVAAPSAFKDAPDTGDTAAHSPAPGTPEQARTPAPADRPPTNAAPTPTPATVRSVNTATATPAPRPSASPVPAPTRSPTVTASLATVHRPAAEAVELTGVTHMWQKWNNCGPATLAMNLSYFGLALEQLEVAGALKPNRDDKNVSPEEMAAFARAQGLNALVRVNGDAERLRLLLSNGVPVLIETWLELEPGNGMGHYRLLTGYDDARQQWTVYDSYVSAGVDASQPYQGIHIAYADVERWWAVFNRTYVLIFSQEQALAVTSILGTDMEEAAMWQRALQQAQTEVELNPGDPFAWFNLASDLVALGRFEEAAAAYDQARLIGLPWRMLWYQFGPFRAYYETGRIQELVALAEATIATQGEIEETYYWKGMGLDAQGDRVGARRAWEHAIALNPNYAAAAAALAAGDAPLSKGAVFE